MRSLLTRWMPVQPGEGRSVGLALVVYFLVMGGLMLGRNARDSFFLKNIGIAYLPYMYAANAVFVLGASLFFGKYVARLERVRFVTFSYAAFLLLLGASRVLLAFEFRWFYPVLYVVVQCIWILSVMVFWTFVGELFDTRQAKRLIPVVALGGLLGMIGVGLFSRPLIRAVGSANLFLAWMAALGIALFLTRAAWPLAASRAEAPAAAPRSREPVSFWGEMRQGWFYLRSTPLLRAMSGIVALGLIVGVTVDFQFNAMMTATYSSQDALTGFLGTFVGLAGFFSLLSQLLLTPWLIRRFGVNTTILIQPSTLLGLTFLMSLLPGYATVFAAKLVDHVTFYTVQESSYQLLYSPISLDRRGRIRAFMEGYLKPLMIGAAGLLLLAVRYLEPSSGQLSFLAMLVAVVWLRYALRVKTSYVQALVDNLRGESAVLRLAAANALARLKDPDSLKILQETLRTGEPRVVVFAIEFIERVGRDEAERLILPLREHPKAAVRAAAVSALARMRSPRLAEDFPRLLEDPDARVRANAVHAMGDYVDVPALEWVRGALTDPAPRVRANAIAVLAGCRDRDFTAEILPVAAAMSSASSTSERASAAYALGHLAGPESLALLLKLLEDSSQAVGVQATRALARLGDVRAVAPLLGRLDGHRTIRREIRRVVAELGQKDSPVVLEAVAAELVNPARAPARVDLIKILGRLPHERAPAILLEQLEREVGKTQASVLRALERQAKQKPLPPAATGAIHRYVLLELEQYEDYQRWQRALPSQGWLTERLLAVSLQEESVFAIERVFDGLALFYGPTMHRVERELHTGSARSRANAFELLDTVLPKELSGRLLSLLEAPPGAQAAPAALGRVLEELLKHRKPWLRACAVHYVGESQRKELDHAVEELLDDESALVREAALSSFWRLRGPQGIARVQAAIQDPAPAVHRLAQTLLQT